MCVCVCVCVCTHADLVKALDAAVEVVLAVVLGKGVLLSVERELAVLDAVRDAASNDAQVARVLRLPILPVLEAEDNVLLLPVAVGHDNGRDGLACCVCVLCDKVSE